MDVVAKEGTFAIVELARRREHIEDASRAPPYVSPIAPYVSPVAPYFSPIAKPRIR